MSGSLHAGMRGLNTPERRFAQPPHLVGEHGHSLRQVLVLPFHLGQALAVCQLEVLDSPLLHAELALWT